MVLDVKTQLESKYTIITVAQWPSSAEGRKFESHMGEDWKTLTDHPAGEDWALPSTCHSPRHDSRALKPHCPYSHGTPLPLPFSTVWIVHTEVCLDANTSVISVMILDNRTDRSGQTVQTQIRLLLRSSLIRVFTVCYSICIFLTKYLQVWPLCLNFRRITEKFSGVRKFRNFTVLTVVYLNIWTSNIIAVKALKLELQDSTLEKCLLKDAHF